MKPIDFIKWLQGYLDALSSVNEDLTRIEDKLEEVDISEPLPTFPQFPPKMRKFEPSDDGKVPFHTVCGCGICGCTMANKMVYPENFRVNQGTTFDNTDSKGHNEF